jgi:malonyl-CoA decarboxylase
VRDEIMQLCAFYLLQAKRGHAPLDPVARFHLANGARLARLNWGGDVSSAGIASSLGITANYVYRMADVEENHEAYAKDFKVMASFTLERLAREVKTT